MKVGRKFLTLDPATWTWHLSNRVEDLSIWDYHYDLECLTKPVIDGKKVRYVELTADQVQRAERSTDQRPVRPVAQGTAKIAEPVAEAA